jgi:hypothetical protein
MNASSYALFFCGRSHDVLPRMFMCNALDGGGRGYGNMGSGGRGAIVEVSFVIRHYYLRDKKLIAFQADIQQIM